MIALALTAALSAPPANVAYAELAARTYAVDSAVLLAIAEHESRFTRGAVNGSACGPLQVMARSEAHCAALVSVELLGYLEGAAILASWTIVAGSVAEGLRGYACGWRGLSVDAPKPCRWFASWVIARAEHYRKAASA